MHLEIPEAKIDETNWNDFFQFYSNLSLPFLQNFVFFLKFSPFFVFELFQKLPEIDIIKLGWMFFSKNIRSEHFL
jgi:hypothetical protein